MTVNLFRTITPGLVNSNRRAGTPGPRN